MKSTGSKVRVVPFVYKALLQSDGSQTYRHIELELPEIEEWGPHLEAIIVHTETESRTANHDWKMVLWFSIDGKNWNGPHDIFNAVTTAGQVIQPAFTSGDKLGLKIKLALAVRSSTGTALDSAIVSAAGAFKFLS